MEFTLTHPDIGIKNILVLFDGVPYEADSNHPWWDEIVDLVLDDDPRVLDLFPIRSVQQPTNLIHDPSFSYFDGATGGALWISEPHQSASPASLEEDALREYERIAVGFDPAFFGGQDPDEEDLPDPEDLAGWRSFLDRQGTPTCSDPNCALCVGPRA
jgi:hypothetical protein